MRTGVLGGTFDPPHAAHILLAERAQEQLHLDRVLFVPAGDPWRKMHREVTPATHRLAMTRLLIEGHAGFYVDDCEVRRKGATYTVDTLRELRERYPEDELFLIIGADALVDMQTWRDPAEIAALATIAVAGRRGVAVPEELPFDKSRLVWIDMDYVDVSSTGLREQACRGESLAGLVPAAVEAYIRENRLYRS